MLVGQREEPLFVTFFQPLHESLTTIVSMQFEFENVI